MPLVFPLLSFSHDQHVARLISSLPPPTPAPVILEANSRHHLRCYFCSKVKEGEKDTVFPQTFATVKSRRLFRVLKR